MEPPDVGCYEIHGGKSRWENSARALKTFGSPLRFDVKLKLTGRKTESTDVVSFIFEPQEPLTWKAGQFLHYVLNHAPTDDRGSDRWFTIASAPFERHVMITTRLAGQKGSSFKKALNGLKVGDTIEVSDLDGDFVLGDIRAEYVFIAGGIGITPFRSILKQAEHDQNIPRVTLLYANREEVAAYKAEFDAMAKQNSNLRIHYLFHPQRIDPETVKKLVPDLKKPLFYVSGPEPMVESVGEMLKKFGVPKEHIKQDWFPGYPED
jgi:ferredoxin-NADP reductase